MANIRRNGERKDNSITIYSSTFEATSGFPAPWGGSSHGDGDCRCVRARGSACPPDLVNANAAILGRRTVLYAQPRDGVFVYPSRLAATSNHRRWAARIDAGDPGYCRTV